MSEQRDLAPTQAAPSIPLEKFTMQARKAFELAQEEARQQNLAYVGTEHLLLGVLATDEIVSTSMLRLMGVDAAKTRALIEHIVQRGATVVQGEITFTPRAVAAAALAVEEARRLAHPQVGPDHVLLGLVREGDGIAAGVLSKFGVTLDKARAEFSHALAIGGKGTRGSESTVKGNTIACRIDDRDLAAIDALIEAGIRSTRSEAGAWLIRAGIEANKALLDTVYDTVAEIRRLREVAQTRAHQALEQAQSPASPAASEVLTT